MITSFLDTLKVSHACTLFNDSIQRKELLYKPLTLAEFNQKFMTSTAIYDLKTYVDLNHDELTGFLSGVIVKDKHKAYITTVVVDPNYRRKGIGSKLLHQFEQDVRNAYPTIQSTDIIFFNPIQFEWIIPNTANHDHPNAPGVDMESIAYLFFLHHGYIQFAKQNSYYKNIEHYTLSEEVNKLYKELKKQKIDVTYFDSASHHGFNTLFDDLKNPYWNDEITQAAHRHEPILIATKDHEIIGFTGPLRIQPSLRGYFAGIGVHSMYRGLGIGKVLFASLCIELKNRGAHYMTLFTGETNPARKIYEREGFVIVKSWANLKKEITS